MQAKEGGGFCDIKTVCRSLELKTEMKTWTKVRTEV